MKDFTVDIYKELLKTLKSSDYNFSTYANFHASGFFSDLKIVLLRHDVDARKMNSLEFARIQASMGIVGTYYFRIIPQSFDEKVIQEISEMGHEVGYHYETMDTCKGNVDLAYQEFCRNLEVFRKLTPIQTICMHGSPLSKFDNRDIWKKYNYKSLGIIAEPYFDLNFNKVFYITDTGRRWDGASVSVRDKVADFNPCTNPEFLKLSFKHTPDLIEALSQGTFPAQFMMTFHPQRWTNSSPQWWKELLVQNLKNQVKKLLVR